MDLVDILELVDKHGEHAFALAIVAMLWLMMREMRAHRKELKKHREDEDETRRELVRVGTAITVLLERDRDRKVSEKLDKLGDQLSDKVEEVVKEITGNHEIDPRIAALDQPRGAPDADDDATPVQIPTPPPVKRRTSPHGYSIQSQKRPTTKGGGS